MQNPDYWNSFRAISAKLRRRFLRKPNNAEASVAYQKLMNQLKQAGAHQLAAYCSLAVARCEQAQGNQVEEAKFMYSAAQLYLSAVHNDAVSAYVTFADNITDATNTYLLAVELYLNMNKTSIAAMLLIELAGALEVLRLPAEAVIYYNKAIVLQEHTPLASIHTRVKAASCRIQAGDYDGAVDTLAEAIDLSLETARVIGQKVESETGATQTDSAWRACGDVVVQAETTRVLLLCLLQPPPDHPKKGYLSALAQFDSPNPSVSNMSPDLYYLLQSVIDCRTRNDVDGLIQLQHQLYRHLSPLQNTVMELVLQQAKDGA